MQKSNRGWTMGSRCKPAAEYDIRVAHGLLRKDSANWPKYAVVTTPSAYAAARDHLARAPEGVVFAEWLDSGHQQELSDGLPDGVELVIGLGGGKALDASKFVALDKDAELVLVPTILSSGAIIHGHVARWDGYQVVGGVNDWPWVDCQYVLVDLEVVLKAADHLHTAGLGDILCRYAGLEEWRRRAGLGQGPAFDPAQAAQLVELHERIARSFAATLDANGGMTAASAANIAQRIRERDSQRSMPGTASGDHPFWIALETANQRTWIHGELVALGAMIITWCCAGDTAGFAERLDRCRVRWRPGQMGLEQAALHRGLGFAPRYMAEKGIDSVLREPIEGTRFDDLWRFLETS